MLVVALALFLTGIVSLSFAPVRERLVNLKLAATLWFAGAKKPVAAGKATLAKPKSMLGDEHTGPAWLETAKAKLTQAIGRVKSLPVFGGSREAEQAAAPKENHRPTPAEILLKKIGAPGSKDASTSHTTKFHHELKTPATPPAATGTPNPPLGETVVPTPPTPTPAPAPVTKQEPSIAPAPVAAEQSSAPTPRTEISIAPAPVPPPKVETPKIESPKVEEPAIAGLA